MDQFDVAIIGAGPGGSEAALTSDAAGFKTALIEKDELGGICLNWGCIPTKALLASSKLISKIKESEHYGIEKHSPIVQIRELLAQKDNIVSNLRKGLEWRLSKTGVVRFSGKARLTDTRTICIDSKEKTESIEAKYIILATGSHAKPFPGIPFDGKKILSSTDLLSLSEIPKSMVIIGGGAVGVEFASFYQALGTQITIVEALPHLVPLEDEEIGKRLEMIYKKRGIQVHTGTQVIKIQPEAETMRVTLEGGEVIHGDKLLIAIGRERNVKDLGLESLGIRFQGSAIQTNLYLQTSVPHIFAIGDLIAGPQLAHAASYEARLVISNLKSKRKQKVRFEIIPNAIFTDPLIASVGLTSVKAKEQGYQTKEVKALISSNGKAWVERETEGLAKLVINQENKRILGASVIGLEAPELIGIMALAIQETLTARNITATVFPHPTASEILAELAKQALQ